MRLKDYHLLNAYLYAGCAVFILTVPLWADMTENGLGLAFAVFMAAVCGFLSYRHFRQAKNTRSEEQAYAPSTDATTAEQVKFYRKYLLMSLIAFPALSLIIVMQLDTLESGDVESISLVEPIAFLYDHSGYWYAVTAIPVAGIIVVLLLIRKIRSGKHNL